MRKDVRAAMIWALESFDWECREFTDSELNDAWFEEFYLNEHIYRYEATGYPGFMFMSDSLRRAERTALMDFGHEIYTLSIQTTRGELLNVAVLDTIEDALRDRL